MIHIIKSLNEWDPVIRELDILMTSHRHFLLKGGLGAGKTTLVKRWMQALYIEDQVTSPTFSLVNHYLSDRRSVYHMDMYRLVSLDEAYNMGIESYLDDPEAICIIEWPELVMPILAPPYVTLTIEVSEDIREAKIEVIS